MIHYKDLIQLGFEKMQDGADDGIMPCTVYSYDFDYGTEDVFNNITLITSNTFPEGEWVIAINNCTECEGIESNVFINDLTALLVLMECFRKMYVYKIDEKEMLN